MRLLIIATVIVTICGCDPTYSYSPPLSYDHRYTAPFSKDVTLVVWEPQEGSVELHKGVPVPLLAPGHTIVLDEFHGEVTLTDPEFKTFLVMEGVDDLEVEIGDQLCAGDKMGVTRQVRMKAYWGQEADPLTRDMSIVRVVRNSVLTDLSDTRLADRVHSVLALPGQDAKGTDINRDDCPFGGE